MTTEASVAGDAPFLTAWHLALDGVPDRPVVLYSGGLDSSLIAYCLGELGRDPRLLTVGLDGAPDVRSGRDGAGRLGLPWEGRTRSPGELRRLVDAEPEAFGRAEPIRSVRLR